MDEKNECLGNEEINLLFTFTFLVVEPTQLNNMFVKLDHFSRFGVKIKNI